MNGRGGALKQNVVRRQEEIAGGLLNRLYALAKGEARDDLAVNGWPLYLWGDTGTGKTCAALWLLDQVPTSAYFTAEALARDVFQHESVLWQVAADSLLLVIDEVGTRSQEEDRGAWQREKDGVKRMADIREYLPTIWISNKPPEEIRKLYDDRIHSRMCSGTVIRLTGLDRRFE